MIEDADEFKKGTTLKYLIMEKYVEDIRDKDCLKRGKKNANTIIQEVVVENKIPKILILFITRLSNDGDDPIFNFYHMPIPKTFSIGKEQKYQIRSMVPVDILCVLMQTLKKKNGLVTTRLWFT